MNTKLVREKQDITYLSWSVYRNSSGTAGSFLKSYSELGGKKVYYKLSNFDKVQGVIGHECVNELIVDRLLTILGIPHLPYQLIHGVSWDVNMTVSDSMLYRIGKKVPLTAADFRNFVTHRVINAAEAAEILGCSRQNIIDLTKRGKLHPLKTSDKNTLYLKSEILKRNWQ